MAATTPRSRIYTVALATLSLIAGLVQALPAQAQTIVLHNQNDNKADLTSSQNYEAASSSKDTEAADDFEVPQGAMWTVSKIAVLGQYNSPTTRPTGANVRIYEDATGLPGALVDEWLDVDPAGGFGSPNYSNFSVPLSNPPQLAAGRYWISVQADLASGAHWSWRNRTTANFSPAAYRNPGDGWETTCSEWGARAAACAPTAPVAAGLATTDPDQAFLLEGSTSPAPTTARFIQLCHDELSGASCDIAAATNDPDDEHELTARVTDPAGIPVPGVPVEFRQTGLVGTFTPQGGTTATVISDDDGLARVLLTSAEEGESTVVAEISPVGGSGSFRGAGPTDDECEQPAGADGIPAAGNCISPALITTWQLGAPEPACDDGIDNDGDNYVDDGDDPGCINDTDKSEDPFNAGRPDVKRHTRSISIRFNDGTGARNNGLVIFGRLRAPDFDDCFSQQPVNIQRRINGRWVTKKTTHVSRRGRYAVEIFDQAARYRAVAPRTEVRDDYANQLDVCVKAVKAKRHRHRR